MVNYQCYRCGYMTNDKSRINRHINRKKTCNSKLSNLNLDHIKNDILNGLLYSDFCEKNSQKNSTYNATFLPQNNTFLPQNNTILPQNNTFYPQIPSVFSQKTSFSPKNKNISCIFCKKEYSRKDSLTRHLKNCREKLKDDSVRESMEKLVTLLNEKDQQLKKQMLIVDNELKNREDYEKRLEKKDKDHQDQILELITKAGIVTTNNNNITNYIQNNIELLNYKDTDTSHLTENDYVKCLEHYNFCVPHLIRRIHFNPKKPENHNIYISNLKNSYIMIYMNNKWKVKNREELISRMIDEKQVLFEKKIQEWLESGNKYPKLMAKFSRYIEKREEDNVYFTFHLLFMYIII